MLRDVVAVVGDRVAAFELGVLSEVFGLDRSGDGLPGYTFALAALKPGLVPTTSGYAVQVPHGLQRLEQADLVAVPSWTTQDLPVPAPLVAALHAAVDRGARVLAVCSGAFLLAGVGLLDGQRAATHWRYASTLAARFPSVLVDPDVLYVDNGQVLTSAGTAAGIDACLHLVRLEHGAAVSNALARRMVVAPQRAGGQAQYVEAPVPRSDDAELAGLLDWARAHLTEPLTVEVLARQALMSPRTFARRFAAATGTTPHRWLLEQRLRHADHLLETTTCPSTRLRDSAAWPAPTRCGTTSRTGAGSAPRTTDARSKPRPAPKRRDRRPVPQAEGRAGSTQVAAARRWGRGASG